MQIVGIFAVLERAAQVTATASLRLRVAIDGVRKIETVGILNDFSKIFAKTIIAASILDRNVDEKRGALHGIFGDSIGQGFNMANAECRRASLPSRNVFPRVFPLSLAALVLVASSIQADEPFNQVARFFGVGWSDGYHVCRDGNCSGGGCYGRDAWSGGCATCANDSYVVAPSARYGAVAANGVSVPRSMAQDATTYGPGPVARVRSGTVSSEGQQFWSARSAQNMNAPYPATAGRFWAPGPEMGYVIVQPNPAPTMPPQMAPPPVASRPFPPMVSRPAAAPSPAPNTSGPAASTAERRFWPIR